MTEQKDKKLSTRARKQLERNAKAVERHIHLLEKEVAIRKDLYALRVDPELYVLADGFQATMEYQVNPRHLELSRQLDEIKYKAEIVTLELQLEERRDQLANYKEQLSARS